MVNLASTLSSKGGGVIPIGAVSRAATGVKIFDRLKMALTTANFCPWLTDHRLTAHALDTAPIGVTPLSSMVISWCMPKIYTYRQTVCWCCIPRVRQLLVCRPASSCSGPAHTEHWNESAGATKKASKQYPEIVWDLMGSWRYWRENESAIVSPVEPGRRDYIQGPLNESPSSASLLWKFSKFIIIFCARHVLAIDVDLWTEKLQLFR